MRAFLIDTDWCIEILRGNAAAIHALVDLRPHGLAMSLITYGELYEGVWYGRDPETAVRHLRALLDDFTMFSITAATMERFAIVRGGLTRH